jgi:hypothetical protein
MFSIVLGALVVAAAVSCTVGAVHLGRPIRSPGRGFLLALMGLLAGLAPISIVVFLRLSVRMCIVANPLGLPWLQPWHDIAHWAGGAIWLASTVLLIIATTRPKLRRAAVAMWMWSGAIAIPTAVFLFLTIYGDAAANCTPY